MCTSWRSVSSSVLHVVRVDGTVDLGPRRVKAGRCGYFRKENSAKFAHKPLKTFAWPCQCVKQPEHQQLLLQGLHPSRAGHRRWFSCGPQVGEHSGRRGSWMPAWPRRVPVASRLRLSLRGLRTPADDTLRTFANSRVAQHPVDPLGIAVGVRDYCLGICQRPSHWQIVAIRRPLEHP